jgi:hypothetical protein
MESGVFTVSLMHEGLDREHDKGASLSEFKNVDLQYCLVKSRGDASLLRLYFPEDSPDDFLSLVIGKDTYCLAQEHFHD